MDSAISMGENDATPLGDVSMLIKCEGADQENNSESGKHN